MESIPIIDLFAGPGGLGEGFSSELKDGTRPFRIAMSVEKDAGAHKTLSLRAFYRYFLHEDIPVPDDYYDHLAGDISLEELFEKYPNAHEAVEKEAINATLGGEEFPDSFFDEKITEALVDKKDWLLIGGPPCQAYSLVGRSRMLGALKDADGKLKDDGKEFYKDHRHKLYQEYLRIIYKFSPPVFVMENVKGILSAKLDGKLVFPKIIEDLTQPDKAAKQYKWTDGGGAEYRILSFVKGADIDKPRDYLIECEKFGIPQARHRVILLGVREDIWEKAEGVEFLKGSDPVSVNDVIGGLPRLRSGFSKGKDGDLRWSKYFRGIPSKRWVKSLDQDVREEVLAACETLQSEVLERKFMQGQSADPTEYVSWYIRDSLTDISNHGTRSHMDKDLDRYLFVSAYGKAKGSSPRLKNFPKDLLPKHENVQEGIKSGKFADRFKVQLEDNPASTITSHISKDGHYFIHPDPSQCRSLTVREAARIQTFPDNYFFEGGRTHQYHQVGNAVPPLLANQLAEIVYKIFKDSNNDTSK